MAGISKEQLKRDEKSLAVFLVLFDIALLGAFLLISLHQG
jgi:hypothetical protein